MKKIFLSTAILFAFVFCVNAQNSSPYWSLAGNSNATSSSKLGTTNGINLRFYTNNSERARITTSGLFGIGTTSPTDKLHVNSASGTNAFRAQVNGSTKFIVHSNGNVGIGTSSPSYKLHVVGSTSSGTGTYSSGYGYGLQAYSTYTYGIGVYGYSDQGYGVNGYSNYLGVYGYGGTYGVYASGGSYGTYGYSYSGNGAAGVTYIGTAVNGTSYDYGTGVSGSSASGIGVIGTSTDSYGGYFYSTNGYPLVASVGNSSYAGVFYGRVYASDGFVTSDKNLKKDIQEFGGAMILINKLKPHNYLFKDDAKYASLHLPKGRHYGLLAQDLEQVLPNLVSEAPHELKTVEPVMEAIKPTADGKPQPSTAVTKTKETTETINIKAVNYVELIPIMVKAIQELNTEKDKKISDLQSQINDLKALILKNSNNSTTSLDGYLKQNTPNPASTNTIISYYTPDNTKSAQILISDMKGSVLKAFTLSKGQGQVNIRSGELSTGTYNYTLYVNNSKIETKQMIITK